MIEHLRYLVVGAFAMAVAAAYVIALDSALETHRWWLAGGLLAGIVAPVIYVVGQAIVEDLRE